MTQKDALEHPGDVAGEHSLGECSPWPSVAAPSSSARPRTGRSEARRRLHASLWLTSLEKPGVFEVVPTENVSRFGIQMVTQKFWEPAELVLVSSPPGFCVQGSVVYCKKLPSDEYVVGIGLDAPVEHSRHSDWEVLTDLNLEQGVKECPAFLSPKAAARSGSCRKGAPA